MYLFILQKTPLNVKKLLSRFIQYIYIGMFKR